MIIQILTVPGNIIPYPVNDLMLREVSFLGTFRYADEFPFGLRLIASGRLDALDKLVTGVHPLKDINHAIQLAATGANELKVQLAVGD